MHYEKAPRFRRSRPDGAPPSLRCAVQGFASAALESNCSIVAGGKELQERLVKLAGEWHFYLEGKDNR